MVFLFPLSSRTFPERFCLFLKAQKRRIKNEKAVRTRKKTNLNSRKIKQTMGISITVPAEAKR